MDWPILARHDKRFLVLGEHLIQTVGDIDEQFWNLVKFTEAWGFFWLRDADVFRPSVCWTWGNGLPADEFIKLINKGGRWRRSATN